MSIRCRVGLHRDEAVARFEADGCATIYGTTCHRCGRPRLTIGGARPTYPGAPGSGQLARYHAQRLLAREWIERELGRAVVEPVVWWR